MVSLNSGGAVTITTITSSTTAVGTYTVLAGHNATDLTANVPLTLSAGILQDGVGLNADLSTIPGGSNLGDLYDIVIDTTDPAIVSVTTTDANGTYSLTDTVNVTVTFSEPVTLSGGKPGGAFELGRISHDHDGHLVNDCRGDLHGRHRRCLGGSDGQRPVDADVRQPAGSCRK